jgi:WhiB family redox-sensing transcriptional regulator
MSDLAEFLTNHESKLDWLEHAMCKDMDISDFFVEAGHTINQEVINICRTCPVRQECLEHAYRHSITGGYFGGVSPGQRREMTLEKATAYVAADDEPVKPGRARRKR